jgi:outer membrane protein assembly factor BamD
MRRLSGALLLCAAASLYALHLAGCAAVSMPAIHSEPERLEVARKMAKDRDYTAAIEQLKLYVERNAGSAHVDEAIYLLGECYLKSKDFPNAAVEFERLGRDFPESDSSAAAAFGLGDALYGQSRPPDFDQEYTNKALEQWEHYRRDYPYHWLVPKAEERIAKCRAQLATKLLNNADLYYKLRQYDPARIYYQQVEQEYGDTPLLGNAMIGRARCDAMDGRIAEAIEYLKEMEQRFAGQPLGKRAASERSRIQHMGKIKPQKEQHRIPENPSPPGQP